jgi:hypothetical protein
LKKRENAQRSLKKYVLQSKNIEKYMKHDPPLKARGESQSKEYLEKINKNIPHTCTSRSSCMTSFFLDPVFGSTTLWGTSESHAYPTQSSTYKPYSRKLRLIQKPLVR